MSELSIKINIAERMYPLSVKMEEEEGIRKTAKMINEKIKHFENEYAVKDKQDLLAMCALDFASSNESAFSQYSELEKVTEELRTLNQQAEEILSSR